MVRRFFEPVVWWSGGFLGEDWGSGGFWRDGLVVGWWSGGFMVRWIEGLVVQMDVR
mgnify:CR=1 FL=1